MFLMAPILAGLVAVSIPVLIHLLHRQRTTPVKWGAMQFLLESPLQLKRRKRIDHWLLMLLRAAAIALVVFALARPLDIDGTYNPLGSGVATDVAVVVDRSLSTGRRAGDSSIFAKSVTAVADLAKTMRPGDTLTVVLAEHRPAVQSVRLAPVNAADVTSKLKALGPGMSNASIPEAVQTAREILAEGRNARKMILVVSDEQRGNWSIEDRAAWELASKGVKLYSLPILSDGKASDVAVADVAVSPSLIGLDRPASVTASVTNSGPDPVRDLSVQFFVDGKLFETRLVPTLPAGESRTVQFDHRFTEPGSHWLKVQADTTDALESDNSAVLAANVWERLPVLVIDGQLSAAGEFRSSQFLLAALQPAEGRNLVDSKVVSVTGSAAEKLDDYAVVIVNDVPRLPGEVLTRLSDHARSGRAVWFMLGPRTEQSFIASDLADVGLITLAARGIHKPDADQQSIEVKDPRHPAVRLITAAERNVLTGAVARGWWRLDVPAGSDANVILATQAGDPLVLERAIGNQGGRVTVWATDVASAWNNWPVLPHFVPLVNETLFHLAVGQTRGLENRRLTAGESIVWTGPAEPRVIRASLTRPDETTLDLTPRLAGPRQVLSYNDTFLPGLYTLRFDQTAFPQVYFGVGIDPRELETTSLSPADHRWLTERGFLEKRLNGPDELASAVGAVNKGQDLWPMLAGVLLATLVLETLMTWRVGRHQAVVA